MKLLSFLVFLLVGSLSISQQQITFNPASNNTTVITCNGFIIDSGGQGGPGYSNNENVTITICPDTIATGNNDDFINIIFNLFNLDTFDDNPAPNQQNLDVMYVYDGPSTASPTLGNYTGNGLANTTIQATNLNPTGCITLQFVSNTQNNAGNWQFTASATCATPCDPPVALGQIVGGDASDSIRVCVGDLVNFMENGSFAQPSFNIASYEWNFMDGTTLPGSQGGTVSHAFSVPGHYVVNLYVTDDNQDEVCQNANLTELNVFVANPPTFYEFPEDTTLCIGESIDLVAQPEIFDSLWSGFIGSTQIDDGCMYDTLLGVAQVVPIQMTGFDEPTITDAGQIESVCLDMEHSFMGDLVIQVECPDGTIVTLHQQGGGGTQIGIPVQTDDVDCLNGLNQGVPFTYCFTPTATETWVDWVNNNGWGQTLPAGDYAPVQPLSGLVGCPISGTWNLIVTDNWGADDGTVFGWSINLVDSLYPDVVEFEPHVGDNSDSSYWDNSGSFITNITPDGNIASVTPTAPGTFQYNYSVWDDYGCYHDSTVTITVDPQIFISAGLDTSVCNGQLVTIGDNSGGGGGATCDYVLDLVDTFGDGWNGNSIDVTVAGVTTNYSPGGTGQTVTLSVTHGDQIDLQWNATGSWQSENEIYLYDSDGVLIFSDGTPGIPSTTLNSFTADCFGGMVFEWTPNDGSLDDVTIPNPTVVNPTTTTTYTLAVYPVGHPQCATTDDVVVSIGGGLDAGTDSTKLFCFEGAPEDLYTYLGGTPQLGGQWYNPAGQAISMPIQPDTISAGLYEYRRDSAGCTASAFIDVSITQIDVSAIVNNSDCNAFNGEVQLIPSNTMGTVQFSNDNGVNFQNSDTFIGGMGSGNTYSFLIQDSVGCIATIDTIVIDDNFPVIDVASIVTVDSDCGADNGQVTLVTTNGGTPNYTYTVDGITVGFNALPLTDLPPSTPNTYDLIVEDNFGCRDTAQITINEINTPLINSIDATQISCYTVDDAQIVINGVNLQSYSIDGGVTNQNSNTFSGLAPGTYDIIAYSGPNGTLCTVTDQVVITDLTPLQIDTLSANITVCPGDEVSLGVLGSGGNGNYTYDWDYLGNSLGQGSTITVTADFAMQVCVTMSEDCPSPTTTQCMNISTAPDIYPALMASSIDGCYPVEVDFTNITNNPMVQSTDWIFSDDGSTITAQGNDPVNYVFENPGVFNVDMVITSVDGCVYDTTYSQLITVYDHPDANFVSTPNPLTIYETEAHFIDYSGGNPVQWQWNFGSGAIPLTSNEQNPRVVYPQGIAAIYPVSLYVTNEFGCVDSLISQVQVINDVIIYAPNVFTPDNDGFNQTWRVYISGIDIYEYHLILFNRWGEIVWESYNPEAVWKGTYGTDDVEDGTYVWVLNAKDSYNDKKYEFRGTVSVLR
jgi:gliding motility-associated-like protein